MYSHIASNFINTHLMLQPGKAAAIITALGGRILGGEIEFNGPAPIDHIAFEHGRPHMGTVGNDLGRRFEGKGQLPFDLVGNVAIIPVEGTLIHKGGWIGSESGETSYQGLQAQVLAAARAPNVAGVAFEIDSFGGEVSGAFETSDMIHTLSHLKPTIAILSDQAYSAGYLMASAARQIVVPAQGGTGSIGVMTMHRDISKALEGQGIKITLMAAGAHKVDLNPIEPLDDKVKAQVMADLEKSRIAFASKVYSYRGTRLSFDAAMATEADTFNGEDSVKLGLADAIGNPFDAFQAFYSNLNRA